LRSFAQARAKDLKEGAQERALAPTAPLSESECRASHEEHTAGVHDDPRGAPRSSWARCPPQALAVFSFRENWDQFLWPLVIASKEGLKTFPLGLALFEGSFNASYHEMMAAAVVGMIPMILLFLLFQRAFVRGLTLTGLKE